MEGEKKPLEILVVEDLPEYLDVAKQAVEELQDKINLRAEYINNFDDALKKLDDTHYDGVITDLFEGDDKAKGLQVYLKCIKKGIKVGILTDGDRHYGNLGALRVYLDCLALAHKGKPTEKTDDWYKGKELVEEVVNPEELFRELSEIYRKEQEEEREKVKSRYEALIEKVRREGVKAVAPNTNLSTEEFIEVLKEELEEDLRRLSVPSDPVYKIDGFIIGRTGTDKLDKENWKIAIQRVLKIGEIGKKKYFHW